MKTRSLPRLQLWVEELESRLVPSTVTSTNWSGYAVLPQAGATVTQVSADWIVPTASAKNTNTNTSYSSFWVGIDGYYSSTVEQIGTDSDILNGVPTYYAWYEMYPRPYHTIVMTVTPGDTIFASVTSLGSSKFALQLNDVTTGAKSAVPTQTLPGAKLSSAEWIAEAPSGRSVLPLANFGTAAFSNASATINGQAEPISAFTNNAIDQITSKGVAKATPSALDSTGAGFSVTWKSSGVAAKGHGSKGGSHAGDDSRSTLNPGNPNVPTLASAASPFLAPVDLNRAALANQAFSTFQPAAAVSQAANYAPASSRFGSFGFSDADLLDVAVPPQQMREAPAPSAQPIPMPDRNPPPAAPAPMPMQPELSSQRESAPPILDVEAVAPDAPAQTREVREVGFLKSLINLIGGVGAFALFGNAAISSDFPAERKQVHRDRTRGK